MASVTLVINGGTPPYSISVKKVGETTERFISYSGSTLTFTGSNENNVVTYNVIVTDAIGCSTNGAFGLNCSITNPDPTFNHTLTQPTCNPDFSYSPAQLNLTNILNATRYKICYNTLVFDCGDCTVSDGIITGSSQIINLSTPTVPTSRFFIMRVYNGAGCDDYKEISGTIITPTCSTTCNISTTIGTPSCDIDPEEPDCNTYDITFAIDESGSISPSSFELVKDGIKNMLLSLKPHLDSGTLRISYTTFGKIFDGSTCTRTINTLTSDYTDLVNTINSVSRSGGGTPIATGLKTAYESVTGFNTRNNNKKVILITDGEPSDLENCVSDTVPFNNAKTAAINRANTIKTTLYNSVYNTRIITVGINMNTTSNNFLRDNIASSTGEHFIAESFNDFTVIANSIAAEICR